MARVFDLVEEVWNDAEVGTAFRKISDCTNDSAERFEGHFLGAWEPGARALLVESGTAALRGALSLVHAPPRRRDVAVPAFCCASVAEAILDTGFRPVLFDSGDDPGDLDWKAALDLASSPAVAAMVIPHLFGLSLDIRELVRVAARHGVVVIEDCAQCMGATVEGVVAGSSAEFAIFSFFGDKPLSLGGGGLVVANARANVARNAWQALTDEARARLANPRAELEEMTDLVAGMNARRDSAPRTAGSWARRVGRVLRRIRRHGFHEWRRLREVGGPTVKVGALRAELGVLALEQMARAQDERNRNFRRLADILEGAVRLPRVPPHSAPAWLRMRCALPAATVERAGALESYLAERGFRGGRLIWSRTLDQDGRLAPRMARSGSLERARLAARSGVDLPIHQNLRSEDVERLGESVRRWLADGC